MISLGSWLVGKLGHFFPKKVTMLHILTDVVEIDVVVSVWDKDNKQRLKSFPPIQRSISVDVNGGTGERRT